MISKNNFKLFFINLYIYLSHILASMVLIPVLTVFVSFLSLFLSHRCTMKRFRRAISWYGRMVVLLPYPFIKVHYEDISKNDTSEPYIFVCNHRSFSDPYLMCFLPHECIQVVNRWPFHIPVLGIYARLCGYLDINGMPTELFFEKALKSLNEKTSIIFFPEGTRSGNRKIGHFHSLAFRLALQAKVPIVPVCVSGNENIPPKGSMLMQTGTIRVRRLPAIQWKDYKDRTVFSLKNNVREIIRNELSSMESGI